MRAPYQASGTGMATCPACILECKEPEVRCFYKIVSDGNYTDRLPWRVSGEEVVAVDTIPLYNKFAGGVAYRIYVPGSPVSCDVPHWWALSKDPRILYTYVTSLEKVLKSSDRYHADLVFVDGPEPLLNDWVLSLMKSLSRHKGLAIRTIGYASPQRYREAAKHVDAVVFDYLGLLHVEGYRQHHSAVLRNLVYLMDKGVHVELVIYLAGTHGEGLVDELIDTLKGFEEVIIHVTCGQSSVCDPGLRRGALRLVEALRRHLKSPYIYSHVESAEARDTVCPYCGRVVIRRESSFVHKCYLEKRGLCPFCGRRISVECLRGSTPILFRRKGVGSIWLSLKQGI